MVRVRGYDIDVPAFRDSFDRRAVQVQNRIMATLKQLNIDRDDVDCTMEKNARLKNPGVVSWWFEGRNLRCDYSLMGSFIENLYIVDKILEIEVNRLLEEKISLESFQNEFASDEKLDEKRADARKLLGVDKSEDDFDLISRKYKALARKFHPDMEGGSEEMFQKINAAHKLIKKELE